VARSNFIWSDDRGETWNHGPPAVASGNPRTSEAQIVELDNGSLLLSMRNENRPGTRLWNIFSWDKETETIAEGAWGTAWSSQTDPTVMASLIRYRSTLDGHPWSGLLFSNPDSTGREKMTIRLSLDEGQTWPYKRKIDDLPAAYSCMTVLPNGDIGILYETGEASSISRLVFARFTLEWLVGDADSDGDGLSDFQEDVLGLDKADPADAEADADGDGMSNREEARANTGINDATSVLKARLQTTPSGMSLLLPSVVNTTYWLESTSSLASGVWTPVPGLKANASNSNGLRFDLPNRSEERLFYRIVVP
jgi:hypothetical protein